MRKADVTRAIRDDAAFYGAHLAKIVDKRRKLIPLEHRPAQRKLWAKVQEMRAADKPVRIIILKSRQTGISTWVQMRMVQRATQREHSKALTVAHDTKTASALFSIGERVYTNLPEDPEIKPGVISWHSSEAGRKLLHWGNKARDERAAGMAGLDSEYRVDTAGEVEAGRGMTLTDLHGSEVAFWPDPRKFMSLLEAVPGLPETEVYLESTANGFNFFKEQWDAAERGESDFEPVFISWLEDPDCYRVFADGAEREAFVASIGTGPWGAAEPELVTRGATPEQLFWRRRRIITNFNGKISLFMQEYPSTPEEAFIGTGRRVFATTYIRRALLAAEELLDSTPPRVGILKASATRTRELEFLEGKIEVPTAVEFWPAEATGFGHSDPFWTVWRRPEPDGQYICALDPADDVDNQDPSDEDRSFSAIQVIDHRTGEQCAEWCARADHDLVGMQLLLAAIWFNRAWIGVEVTGGYGNAICTSLLWKRIGYERLYRRPRLDQRDQKQFRDRLGWSTDNRSKPMMEATFAEMLREGTHGVRSVDLAREMLTYVKDDRGRHVPEDGHHSDRLLSYMQAQEIRRLTPLRLSYDGPLPSSLTRDLGGWG